MKKIIKNRSKGICEYCFSRKATEIHHIKLRSRLGLDYPQNLIHLCTQCHVKMHRTVNLQNELLAQLKKELENILTHETYTISEIKELLDISIDDITHAIYKNYLDAEVNEKGELIVRSDNVMRWLV